MIQSSPHSHAAEALTAGAGPGRASSGKAKRNGLASLFSSMLADAKSTVEAAAKAAAAKPKEPSSVAGKAAVSNPVFSAKASSLRGEAAVMGKKPVHPGQPKPAAETAIEQTGKQAQTAKHNLLFRETTEQAEKDGSEGVEKARLSRRRSGIRDVAAGADGDAGAAQLAATSLVGQRNLSARVMKAENGDSRENKVESSETRKKDKRKERLEIELYDHRTGGTAPSPESAGLQKPEGPASGDRKAVAEADLVVNLRAGNAERGAEDAPRPGAATGTSFSDALARELRENANADIVKHASLVLKDGGEGLLRLSLKPDTLGAVKIRLEMADNRIAGRILVESDEALKAFEKELASLEQAFRDGGFDGASLELAVSSNGARGGGERGGEGKGAFFSERLASTYDASVVPVDGASASSSSESLVNVLV